MIVTCTSMDDACRQAARLRQLYPGWRWRILLPLFDGDSWRVVVS